MIDIKNSDLALVIIHYMFVFNTFLMYSEEVMYCTLKNKQTNEPNKEY